MKKLFSLAFVTMLLSYAASAQVKTLTGGPATVCMGSTITLADSVVPGGVWTSGNTAVATVAASPGLTWEGIVTPVTAGTANITYTVGGTSSYLTVTVDPTPAAITGGSTVCVGATTTLVDATSGGVWSAGGGASVGSGTGVVTGVSGGTAYIYYTLPAGGCYAYKTVTVSALPIVSLKGTKVVCVGSTISITDSLGGSGTWSSSATSVATVSSSGVVTGMSGGTATISFAVTNSCGTTTGTIVITVPTSTSAGTITGATTVMATTSTTLADAVTGGVWSSSNTAVATVSATSGIVSGVAAGSCTITYTVTGCGGTAYTTSPMSVTAFDGISGYVHFTGGSSYYGPVKVYLITYNPTTLDLEAYDSTTVSGADTIAYYSFNGVPTNSYRMKAAIPDTMFLTSGYLPTYHTSSFYWSTATVLSHTSGTSDINQDITMGYGPIVTGPGFIGGNVTTGANKGTSTTYAVGLRVYLLDASSNAIKATKTDASGNYSFSNLPVGTYTVFPEALNFNTVAYTSINITTAAPTMSVASFVQHTISLKINPITKEGINNTNVAAASAIVFPNPTNGKLNIQWNVLAAEKGTVTVSDIAGRELYTTSIDMTQGTGVSQLDLSALTNGLYLVSVSSASVNYNNKIQIAR